MHSEKTDLCTNRLAPRKHSPEFKNDCSNAIVWLVLLLPKSQHSGRGHCRRGEKAAQELQTCGLRHQRQGLAMHQLHTRRLHSSQKSSSRSAQLPHSCVSHAHWSQSTVPSSSPQGCRQELQRWAAAASSCLCRRRFAWPAASHWPEEEEDCSLESCWTKLSTAQTRTNGCFL